MNFTADKMKILFIYPEKFPPYRPDVSILFGKEIVSRGHVIDWLLQSENSTHLGYETQWYGSRVLVGPTDTGVSIMSRAKRHLFSVFHDLKMLRLIRTSGYDFILVRDKFVSGLTALLACKMFNTKLVYWLSFPLPEALILKVREGLARYPLFTWVQGHVFKSVLYRILLPLSNHVFVQTEVMLNSIAAKGISKAKMTAVPMAVSIKHVEFFGHKVNQSGKREKNVVYLGTLMKSRRMDFLLRSFEKVLKRERNAMLYLVGGSEDSSDEEVLKNEAKRLSIGHAVTITGFLPQGEAWEYVRIADVCVSPIYPSPIYNCASPTKLIEYMAMGKAVVANDHPEQSLVISESKGGICVPYDEHSFSQGILYLLENPEVARQMGMRGREYIEKKRNYEQTADLVEKKLLQILTSM